MSILDIWIFCNSVHNQTKNSPDLKLIFFFFFFNIIYHLGNLTWNLGGKMPWGYYLWLQSHNLIIYLSQFINSAFAPGSVIRLLGGSGWIHNAADKLRCKCKHDTPKNHTAKATISLWLSKQHLVTLHLSSAGDYTQSENITKERWWDSVLWRVISAQALETLYLQVWM